MDVIAETCIDGDGLKWFNDLYFQVTQAVKDRIASGGFRDPQWLAGLDVQFGRLYFRALASSLSGQPTPGCWLGLATWPPSSASTIAAKLQSPAFQFALAWRERRRSIDDLAAGDRS